MSYDKWLLLKHHFAIPLIHLDNKWKYVAEDYPTNHSSADMNWCLENLNTKFKQCINTGSVISMDESMELCKTRCTFTKRMKNKPIGEGLRVYMACDSSANYCVGIVMDNLDRGKTTCISIRCQQCGKPVYFYSRKFSSQQTRYTVMKKEALAVVSILEHLKNMLYGAVVHIYTDNMNLSYLKTAKSMKLIRYYHYIMDFNPTIQHVKGSENMLAVYLSRMNFKETAVEVNSVEDMFPFDAKIIKSCQELDEYI